MYKIELDVSCFYLGSEYVGCISKAFELPFAPFKGLQIMFDLHLNSAPEQIEEYANLVRQVTNHTGIVTISSVFYCMKQGREGFQLMGEEIVANSIEEVKAYMELMCKFYKFDSELSDD